MIKHQRRAHRIGKPLSDGDDFSEESDYAESPSTPSQSGGMWPMSGHELQSHNLTRASSYTDFGSPLMDSHFPRHPMSTPNSPQLSGAPIHAPQGGLRGLYHQGATSIPQQFSYVTDHNNPGVATMNTSVHPYHHVPRNSPHVHGLGLDIPYTTSDMGHSIQNSPIAFSPASGRSDLHDGFFRAHHAQPPAYAIPTSSPVVDQPTVGQMHHTLRQQTSTPHHQVVHQIPEPYHSPVSQPDDGWYSAMPYSAGPPIEVTTIGHMPVYGSASLIDPFGIKDDVEDPMMQMPSARIDSM